MKKQFEENRQESLSLDLPAELAVGIYSNLVVISHSPSEFVLDFARIMPGVETPKVVSRVIMTPDHTKRFLRALSENVTRYEKQHGEIHLPESDSALEMPFSTGMAPEA